MNWEMKHGIACGKSGSRDWETLAADVAVMITKAAEMLRGKDNPPAPGVDPRDLRTLRGAQGDRLNLIADLLYGSFDACVHSVKHDSGGGAMGGALTIMSVPWVEAEYAGHPDEVDDPAGFEAAHEAMWLKAVACVRRGAALASPATLAGLKLMVYPSADSEREGWRFKFKTLV